MGTVEDASQLLRPHLCQANRQLCRVKVRLMLVTLRAMS